MSMTNWRELILEAMKEHGESLEDIRSNTLTEQEMDVKFNCGYGSSEGLPFTAWTEKRVYFPVVYDGAEWFDSVSRNPDGKATHHVGGE